MKVHDAALANDASLTLYGKTSKSSLGVISAIPILQPGNFTLTVLIWEVYSLINFVSNPQEDGEFVPTLSMMPSG